MPKRVSLVERVDRPRRGVDALFVGAAQTEPQPERTSKTSTSKTSTRNISVPEPTHNPQPPTPNPQPPTPDSSAFERITVTIEKAQRRRLLLLEKDLLLNGSRASTSEIVGIALQNALDSFERDGMSGWLAQRLSGALRRR